MIINPSRSAERRAPDVGDLERRRGDEDSRRRIRSRLDDQKQECQRRDDRQHVEEGPRLGDAIGDHRRHPHVLAPAERDHRAQHGQPQEQDRGQLVRPDQGPVKT